MYEMILTVGITAALRFFRACLKLGNRNLFMHLIKHDAIMPILELTAREAKWDNLLSSCCQEFFEHIRKVRCSLPHKCCMC